MANVQDDDLFAFDAIEDQVGKGRRTSRRTPGMSVSVP
jgi:hypothetical protein